MSGRVWRLVKLQRPPPEMRIFLPGRFGALEDRNAAAAAAGFDGGHQARGASAENENVEIVRSHGVSFND